MSTKATKSPKGIVKTPLWLTRLPLKPILMTHWRFWSIVKPVLSRSKAKWNEWKLYWQLLFITELLLFFYVYSETYKIVEQ